MSQPKKQRVDPGKETSPKTLRQGLVNQGPEALPELPDGLALQRAVAEPTSTTPDNIMALQRLYGNTAVQRLSDDPTRTAPAAVTSGNRQISWQLNQDQPFNCHGWTYGTWARWKRNPLQGNAGVGRIVEDEAGGEVRAPVTVAQFKGNFAANRVQKGNLITIDVPGQPWAHSMKVVQSGATIAETQVNDVQGYTGQVTLGKPLDQVSQMGNNNNTIHVWNRTPTAL